MKNSYNTYQLFGVFVILILSVTDLFPSNSIFLNKPEVHSDRIKIVDADGNLFSFKRKLSYTTYDHGFTWTGDSEDNAGYITFAVNGDKVRGSLSTFKSKFQFHGSLQKQKIISNSKKIKQCGGCKFKEKEISDPRLISSAQRKHRWRMSDAGQIDLMVVCPAAVKNAIGALDDALLEIHNAIAGANLCFRNSDVQIQLRLVHVHETDYTPTGNLDIDLDRLTGTDDGFLDEVHGVRDAYGADVVTLLSTDSNLGGLANTLSYPSLSFEDSAFNVCVWDQIGAPAFTLAHEIGHNMGCLHNREDASDESQSSDSNYGSFAYGKRWQTDGEGFRTVMAYDDSTESYGNSIPFFSNPNVLYQGVATGNSGSENNALVLQLSSPYVSNFRTAKIQGILPNVLSASWSEGDFYTFKIRLGCLPEGDTVVNLALSDSNSFILVSPDTVTFDETNWNLQHSIVVFANQDKDLQGANGFLTFSSDSISSAEISLVVDDNSTRVDDENYLFGGLTVNPYGYPVGGVSLNFSSGGHSLQSDGNGSFVTFLPEGFSGRITPYKKGFSFEPQAIEVENLNSNSLAHVFTASRSSVIFVDRLAEGNNDGTSWADAYRDLNLALESIDSFSEVWVARGTYYPPDVRSGSFVLPQGVSVIGGFAGNETELDQRDLSENPTILSGNIGSETHSADNSHHVLIPLNGSLLDGFIIQDGNATENFNDDRGVGAGLWSEGTAFLIRNCKFANNWALQGGGGVWLKEVNATFENCVFDGSGTGATGSGGAIWAIDSNISLLSCQFTQNQAAYWGGAVRSDEGALNISHSTFSKNQSITSNGAGAIFSNKSNLSISSSLFVSNYSTHEGGAILMTGGEGFILDSNFSDNLNQEFNGGGALFIENASPFVSGCTFSRNKTYANNYGGAVQFVSSNSTIQNCQFWNNQSVKNSGGAIYMDENSDITISHNFFKDNFAISWGGAIYSKSKQLNITGGTFVGNWANLGGGVATYNGSDITFQNLKIFGNEANVTSDAKGGFAFLGTGSKNTTFNNCVISGNKSSFRHGVISASGDIAFLNCTLYGNKASKSGAVILLFAGDKLSIKNSILLDNADENGYEIAVNSGIAEVEYSLLDIGQSPGVSSLGNILDQDPMFTNAAGIDSIVGTEDDNFSLSSGSPAIDSGSINFFNYQSSDILAQNRDEKPDLGAYEFSHNHAPGFSLQSTFFVRENEIYVVDINATDLDGDALYYSLSGGVDKELFVINQQTGKLVFFNAPDYEFPSDSNGDNKYDLEIQVTDLKENLIISVSVIIVDQDETADSPESSKLLINGFVLFQNWRQASWFGTYYTKLFPWVYHTSMGWVYLVQSKHGDAWIWEKSLGWTWTDIGVFPHFYINSTREWGYTGSGTRLGQYYLFESGKEGWFDF